MCLPSLRVLRGLMGTFAILLFILSGCSKNLSLQEFVQVYEAKAKVVVEKSGYKIIFLYQNPDYLAAKSVGKDADAGQFEKSKSRYEKAHYVSLSIVPMDITSPENAMAKSLLNSHYARGKEAFGKRLEFLLEQLGDYVYLEDDSGEKVSPITYNFPRNFETNPVSSFLFVFPREVNGKAIDVEDYQLVVKDIGLNTGSLDVTLTVPKGIKVKV